MAANFKINPRLQACWLTLLLATAMAPAEAKKNPYEQLRSLFPRIKAEPAALQAALRPATDKVCSSLDSTHGCYGKLIPYHLRRAFFNTNYSHDYLFAEAYMRLKQGVDLFVCTYTEVQDPHPAIMLYTFRHGKPVDELFAYHTPIPADNLLSEVIETHVLKLDQDSLTLAVSEYFTDHAEGNKPGIERFVQDSSIYRLRNARFSPKYQIEYRLKDIQLDPAKAHIKGRYTSEDGVYWQLRLSELKDSSYQLLFTQRLRLLKRGHWEYFKDGIWQPFARPEDSADFLSMQPVPSNGEQKPARVRWPFQDQVATRHSTEWIYASNLDAARLYFDPTAGIIGYACCPLILQDGPNGPVLYDYISQRIKTFDWVYYLRGSAAAQRSSNRQRLYWGLRDRMHYDRIYKAKKTIKD